MSENKEAASVPLPVLSPTGVAGDNTEGDLYDAVIIGGGPAGLSAAIYMTRAGYRTLVVEAGSYGGQITLTSEVRNYPGIERATGQWLAESMHRQAAGFGAEFLEAKVQMIDPRGDVKVVATSKGVVRAFSVLIATGAVPRRAGFAGEREFAGFIPNTTLVRDFVDLDERGYIRVDAKQRTNVPGVYAAGDVCAKDLRQVVTAVADGAVAALDMQYLASDMQGKTGQIPPAPVPRY